MKVAGEVDMILPERNCPSQFVQIRRDQSGQIEHSRTSKEGVLLTFASNHCLRDLQRGLSKTEGKMDR